MSKRLLEAFLAGALTIAGVWVAQELAKPYSDLRLWLDEHLVDPIKKGVQR